MSQNTQESEPGRLDWENDCWRYTPIGNEYSDISWTNAAAEPATPDSTTPDCTNLQWLNQCVTEYSKCVEVIAYRQLKYGILNVNVVPANVIQTMREGIQVMSSITAKENLMVEQLFGLAGLVSYIRAHYIHSVSPNFWEISAYCNFTGLPIAQDVQSLNKTSTEQVFFYGDALLTMVELYKLGWHYYQPEKVWIMPVPNKVQRDGNFILGTFWYYDINTCNVMWKPFAVNLLEYVRTCNNIMKMGDNH